MVGHICIHICIPSTGEADRQTPSRPVRDPVSRIKAESVRNRSQGLPLPSTCMYAHACLCTQEYPHTSIRRWNIHNKKNHFAYLFLRVRSHDSLNWPQVCGPPASASQRVEIMIHAAMLKQITQCLCCTHSFLASTVSPGFWNISVAVE